MTKTLTVSASLIRPVLHYISSKGIKVEDLLSAAAIDKLLLDSPDYRISLEEMDNIYKQAMLLTKDENLGLHVGECFAFGSMSIVGHIMRNCRTLDEHLRKVIQYNEIVSDGFRINIKYEKKGRAVINYTITHQDGPLLRHHIECILSAAMKLWKDAAGKIPKPIEVRFKHKAPQDTTEHHRIFQAPVLFNHSMNAIVWEKTFFDIPIILPDSELFSLFDQHAKQVMAEIRSDKPFSKKVSLILIRKLPEELPSIENIADELYMGVRNLQKKLSKEQTSYRKLLEEIHKKLAVSYLKDTELSVAEIGYLVGFSEPSVFSRSFKRWTGLTPNEYRNNPFSIY